MSLRKAKAILLTATMIIGGTQVVYAENIQAKEQIGYERYYGIIEEVETEKNYVEIDVEISFYTSLQEENSPHGGIDAQGNKLVWSTIAVPRSVSLGTKFEIEGYEGTTFVARDRGSVKHIRVKEDGTYRIDMFIPRKSGETDKAYWTRVNNYGKIKRTAKMYIED